MIKLDKDQAKAFDRSKFNTVARTIISSQLDQAFKNFNDAFSFVYTPKQADFGWHPSGDCLPSVSELYQKAYFALHPDDSHHREDLSSLNKTFMVGHYWHQIIQFLLVKEGLADSDAIERVGYHYWDENGKEGKANLADGEDDEAIQDRLFPFQYVRGQGDVAPLVTRNWTGLVDIKTVGSMDFNQRRVPERFAKKYLCQINIYMSLFDLDQAMILTVNKDSGHGFQEYTYVRDDKLIEQIFAKWKFVSECLATGTKPNHEDDDHFKLYIED